MKVCMYPTPDRIEAFHGIGQIVHAQHKYLPERGIEFVGPEQADLFAGHTQQFDMPDIDVLMVHGLYWTGDPGSGQYQTWHHFANHQIAIAARRARVISVPSAWCQTVFQRDMRLSPTVIPHGIDFADWEPGEPKGYVLWNKNRNTDVCDPTPAYEAAQRGVRMVATFLPIGRDELPNYTVMGLLPHDKMKLLIQNASAYLATVKETYGVGTLEALASGVPVVGYNHGGTAEIIQHQVTGYLAEPGNLEDLLEGLSYVQAHRPELSANAREYARGQDWSIKIGAYVDLFEQALRAKQIENQQVSIIITNYNYAQYVGEAIQSALDQTIPCEVIVVDDGSTDDSHNVVNQIRAQNPDRVRTLYQANRGVAAARNAGIEMARNEYCVCLDADDRLDPQYAQVLRDALVRDRGLGVGYTGLALLGQDGKLSPNGWPPEFNWDSQATPHVPPSNTLPCAAMFRKSMWRRAGGYRQEYAPGEDTEFFTRGLSIGFTAQKVVEDHLFHYRAHANSASRTKQYVSIDAWLPWMRDKKFPLAAPLDKAITPVRSYSEPKVSVIIPVGPGHGPYVHQALDSLLGQTLREWEAILVIDDGAKWELIRYPFVKLVYCTRNNTGAARNLGLKQAKAPLCVFLDADDWLLPDALEQMCAAYTQGEGRYVYTDWLAVMKDKVSQEVVPEYNASAMLRGPQHAVTVLMATADARRIGFDETMPVLEDWDFFIRCAVAGIQGVRLAKPLIAVRIHAGRKTAAWGEQPQPTKDQLLKSIVDRYTEYREGVKPMAGCCGGNGQASLAARNAAMLSLFGGPPQEEPVGQQEPSVIRMEYVGERQGAVTYGGPGVTPSGVRYRGGRNPLDRFQNADPRDVAWLEGTGVWKRHVQVQPQQAQPVESAQVTAVLSRQAQVEPEPTQPFTFSPAQESIPQPPPADLPEAPKLDLRGPSVPKRKPGRPRKVPLDGN